MQLVLNWTTYLKLMAAMALIFDTIVASGVRSAWAHGVASDKELAEGDMICH